MLMIQEQGFYNLKLKKYKFKMSSIWLKCDELYNNRSTNTYLFQYHWCWILPLHCRVLFTWSQLHSTTNEISITCVAVQIWTNEIDLGLAWLYKLFLKKFFGLTNHVRDAFLYILNEQKRLISTHTMVLLLYQKQKP